MTNQAAAAHHDDGLAVDRREMPHELDDGLGARGRIGVIVLATDQTVEHEFRRMLDRPEVAFYESRIENDPLITPETLRAMEPRIAAAAGLILPGVRLDVMAFGCTSASMLIGNERVAECIHEVRPGIPTTTPMAAAFAALRALEVRRVALITPYLDTVNRSMRAYFMDHGFAVPVMGSWNIAEDDKAARLTEATIRAAVLDLGRSDLVDAVFVSCSNLRLANSVAPLEAALGKPVTSSNHAMAWHCLRLAGCDDAAPEFGRLFERPLS